MGMFLKIGGLLLFVSLMGCQVKDTDGRLCYQCIDADMDTDCRDAGRLLKKTSDKNDTSPLNWNDYVKDCASEETNNTMCIVEIFTGGQFSKVKSYMRDCSDGRTFSSNVGETFPLLSYAAANNQSTCVYDETGFGTTICVQLCDSDMCNGPEQNFTTSAASSLNPFVASPTLNTFSAGLEISFFISVVLTKLFFV